MVVGLGNPGKAYCKTRHNIGFMVVDQLAREKEVSFSRKRLFRYAKTEDAVLLKPSTYMNLSGRALVSAFSLFDTDSFIVIYDDIYLPLGEVRVREKGSDGGHKGVRSINESLGEDNYCRIRLGIGSPEDTLLSDYVLSEFRKEEMPLLYETKKFACQLAGQFITGNYKQMIDYYSKNNKSYSERIMELSESKAEGGKK